MVSLPQKLEQWKNNTERNAIQENLIESELRDLKEEIEDISKEEKEKENPNETVDIVEKILEFNRYQRVEGRKILKPSHMLSRLPISIVPLKANNSEKLIKWDKKNLRNNSIKVWLTLFIDENKILWTDKIVRQVNQI